MKSLLKTVVKIFTISFKHFKKPFITLIFSSLLMAFGFVWQVNAERDFFDIALNFGTITHGIELFTSFAIFAVAYIITQIVIHISNASEEILEFGVNKILAKEVCEETLKLPPIYFESSKNLDILNKVSNGQKSAVTVILCGTGILTYYIPYFILMSVWLFSQSPLLALAVPIAFLPSIISYYFQAKDFFALEEDTANLRRKQDSYENSIIGKRQMKETRILGCFKYFFTLYKDTLVLINDKNIVMQSKKQRVTTVMQIIKALGFTAVLAIAIVQAINGYITIGVFIALLTSIDMLFSNVDEAIFRQLGTISEEIGSVGNYLKFLNNCEKNQAAYYPVQVWKAANVSFSYPHSPINSLDNVSFEIQRGDTIAIVGENGAGKSTLVKIMLGLYEPTSGTIFNNGNQNMRVKCSAVFQDHVNYNLSLIDNTYIGDTTYEVDNNKVKSSLEYSGISISSFDQGLETLLGREFGGKELSGGQWQRLAIARGIYRTSDFIVFDEPTSNIDPLEESDVYKKIMDVSDNMTTIIVTHRMASVRFADKILVMKEGKIIEEGNHFSLMKEGTEYRKLYTSQSSQYSS